MSRQDGKATGKAKTVRLCQQLIEHSQQLKANQKDNAMNEMMPASQLSQAGLQTGETVVIKVGGGEGVNAQAVCQDVAQLIRAGHKVVMVHGTSAAANALAQRLNVPVRTLQSPSGHVSRYTDAETIQIYTMAAVGQVNTELVRALQGMAINAVGLNGMDGRLLAARRKEAVRAIDPNTGRQRIVRDDFTGKVEGVNSSLIQMMLANGYTPVIAPLAIGEEHEPLNVDGDRAAAQVAAAIGAQTLIILTNVAGLLANFPDERSLVPHVGRAGMERALAMAGGRMKKKVLAAQEALEGGVGRVILADSRQALPIQAAIQGAGTLLDNA
jgi:[amino group carrier protein]-L-2-aminoadipate 6-kinase